MGLDMKLLHLSAAAALLVMAACVAPIVPQDLTASSAGCGANDRQELLNQQASVLSTEKLPDPHRILRPGQVMSADLNPNRLNVVVDAAETITRVYCG